MIKKKTFTSKLIDSIDTNEVVSDLITTHIIPDIVGNLMSYTTQIFMCVLCGKKYRRPPLFQHCICGHNITQTVTRTSIEKPLQLAVRLIKKYSVDDYIKDRIITLCDEMELVFGKENNTQPLISDYM